MPRGIRKVAIAEAVFDLIVSRAGGLKGLGKELVSASGIADLTVHSFKPDGVRYWVFIESESFTENERCLCRAPEMPFVFAQMN